MIKKNNTISFADLGVEHRVIKVDLFERVNQLVDWDSIAQEISKHYTKGQSVDGRESYSGLILFKMLLLQTWYGISDEVVEEQIKDRISFSKFCLISMDEKVPDSTVLCRFRSCLAKANAYEALLTMINQRLIDGKVMLVKGVIVDASLTDTLRKPRGKKEYEVVEDRKEDDVYESKNGVKVVVKIQKHVDTEAAWIVKAGKLHYAYKQHVATNQEGFVLGIHTTAGNASDIKNLGSTLDKIKIAPRTPVFADKGYASAENDTILITKKLKNRILNKAVKNKPLTEIEKQINKVISQTRYKIERTFGSIHKWFKAGIARYVGKIKMHGQHVMQAICYNLKRMPVIDNA